jgi:hypothetical protein
VLCCVELLLSFSHAHALPLPSRPTSLSFSHAHALPLLSRPTSLSFSHAHALPLPSRPTSLSFSHARALPLLSRPTSLSFSRPGRTWLAAHGAATRGWTRWRRCLPSAGLPWPRPAPPWHALTPPPRSASAPTALSRRRISRRWRKVRPPPSLSGGRCASDVKRKVPAAPHWADDRKQLCRFWAEPLSRLSPMLRFRPYKQASIVETCTGRAPAGTTNASQP